METVTQNKLPIPMDFPSYEEIDGQADMTLEYQGCPLVTIRGTDDMSCIDIEDEPQIAKEQLDLAMYVKEAVNNYHSLKEQLSSLQEENKRLQEQLLQETGKCMKYQNAFSKIKAMALYKEGGHLREILDEI